MSGDNKTWKALTDENTSGNAYFSYDPTPYGMNAFILHVPFKNVSFYGYNWRNSGRWENGHCITEFFTDGARIKFPMYMTGGITFFGTDPVPGLSILPTYTNGIITGYSIFVMQTYMGIASDGSTYISKDQCSATLKPLKPIPTGSNTVSSEKYSLSQNRPNPFSQLTTIIYQVPDNEYVLLKVFNAMGNDVATLVNEKKPAGSYEVNFDGSKLASGIYMYRLTIGEFTTFKKMIISR
jgi:hypothetical protein